MKAEDRKRKIIEIAIKLALKRGYMNITRNGVAKSLKVSPSLITYYWSIKDLKNIVVKFALKTELLEIISQALSVNDPLVDNLPLRLKKKVSKFLNS